MARSSLGQESPLTNLRTPDLADMGAQGALLARSLPCYKLFLQGIVAVPARWS